MEDSYTYMRFSFTQTEIFEETKFPKLKQKE